MVASLEVTPGHPRPEVVDLRFLRPDHLANLLDEETRLWRETLDWNFRHSADLLTKFLGTRSLSGYALLAGGQAVGYSYYVVEDSKALIGDLFVAEHFRTAECQHLLFATIVGALMTTPFVRRIECQLMLAPPLVPQTAPGASYLRVFGRHFMSIECGRAAGLKPDRKHPNVVVEGWSSRFQEAAAQLIAEGYAGHVDAQINDQYQSVPGARRFLHNIIQYPGCGTFLGPASFLAFTADSASPCGLILASLVNERVGHITQVCVLPSHRGKGVGFELLRRSLKSMAEAGCRSVSLSVSAANRGALTLYEGLGFRTVREYQALTWAGF